MQKKNIVTVRGSHH